MSFRWSLVAVGVGLGLLGFALLALNSWWSPSARAHGEKTHWLLGWSVSGPAMVAIGAGWFLLALMEPRIDWAPLPWIGLAAGLLGGATYLASAAKVGRLKAPSHYSLNLDTSGLYSFVRHPQALAFALLAIGLGGLSRSIPYAASLPLWIACWIGYTYTEEKLELLPVFGERYREYCKTTPRMWPSPKSIARLLAARASSPLPTDGGTDERETA